MRKQVTAFVLCICLMTAGIPWSVMAESVQETVQVTEEAVTLEETENAVNVEETERVVYMKGIFIA